MKNIQIIIFCASVHFISTSELKDVSEDDIINGIVANTCPDLTIKDENPWCLNCTFHQDRSCEKTYEHNIVQFTYKNLKCSNGMESDCILPMSYHIEFKENSYEDCPFLKENEPNRLCNNCTITRDGICNFYFYGIQCHLREYKCPEYSDRGCFLVHNCTAPSIERFPNIVPSLVSFDGKESLHYTEEDECSDITVLEENYACLNCLHVKPAICTQTTNYTKSICQYHEFTCPQHDNKRCFVPSSCETEYDASHEELSICPDTTRNGENEFCENCTLIREIPCNPSVHVSCVYAEYSCPELMKRNCIRIMYCVAPVSVSTIVADINSVALASLAGAD